MNAQISPENSSSINDANRRSGNFEASRLTDYFLSNTLQTLEIGDMVEEKVQILKEKLKMLLIASIKNSSQQLDLIDSIQRLGVSYHFEAEINKMLYQIYEDYKLTDNADENLHTTALRFRMLRQQRYNVSCEIFNKLTDEKGNFKESIGNDIQGMLSLYEASHFRLHGEDILDRALAFATKNLEAAIENTDSLAISQVRYALKWPILKAMPRLAARHYISFYEEDPLHDHVLLSFAKLDYNILQKLYQQELNEISRWWKELNFVEKLSFARSRCVECYVWALGMFFEPKYSLGRRITTKIIVITSVLDDIYDLYGTFEELQLFTAAIERWDINCIEELPEYMKVYYEALLDLYRRIEQDIDQDNIPYAIHYAKEAMKRQARAYFAEAKWYREGYKPTVEEYLEVGTISACYSLFSPISFLGMVDYASIQAFEWIESKPKMLFAAGIIGRIMNDIVSPEFEQERGDVASAIECYMTEHGVSEKVALIELEKQVTDAWKVLIESYMKTVDVPVNILKIILNLGRLSDFFYKDEDGYSHPNGETRLFLVSLLVDPVPV